MRQIRVDPWVAAEKLSERREAFHRKNSAYKGRLSGFNAASHSFRKKVGEDHTEDFKTMTGADAFELNRLLLEEFADTHQANPGARLVRWVYQKPTTETQP